MINNSFVRRFRACFSVAILVFVMLPTHVQAQNSVFSKVFVPDVIGPDSVSMLVFTIDNTLGGVSLNGLAFTDSLPSGMTLAAPAFVSNTCFGTVTATNGGSSISLADGMVGTGESCGIIVNVTASGGVENITYTNTTSVLTWTGAEGNAATDDLTVAVDRPGFSKSFAPSSVEIGGRSTLTFTIDNSHSGSDAVTLSFTDVLPAGMVVAGPANASTDCDTSVLPATLIAVPGTATISLSSFGTSGFPALGAGSSCSVTVDVIGAAVGSLGNVSGELLAGTGFANLSSGKAAAILEVTEITSLLGLSKNFTDDPVAPGGTVNLEFTVTNKSRADSATGIAFDDDLDATLTGLTATLPPTPNPPCGAGSSLSFAWAF